MLQEDLLFLKAGSDEVDVLSNEIIKLRDEKNALIEEKALEAQRAKDMRECGEFFNGMKSALEIFEDQYVRRLIEKITVYDDRFEFRFRDGQEITVNE